MKKIITSCIFVLTISVSATQAQTLNWSEDIVEIFYANCTECHNNYGIAPFSLINYSGAYNNRLMIQANVAAGIMPPWPPDPSFRVFAHQRKLTQQEVNDIVNWVNAGAPMGDTTLAPSPPVYSPGTSINNPDLILKIPDFVVNTTSDLYQCFVLPTNLPAGTYVKEIEVIPGNREIVHHVLVFQDTTNVPVQLDANDPGPGYVSYGGTGSNNSSLVFGYVPGQQKYELPQGMGIPLSQNANIILQIHYPGGTVNGLDSTKVIIKLAYTPQRSVYTVPVLNHYLSLTNGPLYIPANTVKTFYSQFQVTTTATVLGVLPHMHLIGRSAKAFAVTATNDTIPLVYVPDWKFNWQGLYLFPRLLKIPAGSTIYGINVYDNTSANPYNPNSPPQDVYLGENTTDEMLLYYFAFTVYQPGDENIIIDSTTAFLKTKNTVFQTQMVQTVQLYDPYPNPAQSVINFNYYVPNAENSQVRLMNIAGQTIKSKSIPGSLYGYGTSSFSISDLPAGLYFIIMENKSTRRVKKFIKQ